MMNGEAVDRPPVICPMHAATVALMKASDAFLPYVQDDPVKMARLAKAGHAVAGFENVRVPFDESVEVSAFGVSTGMRGMQRMPIVLESLVSGLTDVDRLHVPDPGSSGKVPAVLDAVELLQKELHNVPIFLGIVTPMTLAMHLRGESVCLLDMEDEMSLLQGLLEKSTEFILEYVHESTKRGVDQIVLEEPFANDDVMDLEKFKRFVEPYEDRVANAMRKEGIESMLQIEGHVSEEQLERLVEIDVDALCIDENVSIKTAKRICARRKMLVIGNVSTTDDLLSGNRLKVQRTTKRCLAEGVDAVAPGCSLEMHTPLENLTAMTSTAKRYHIKTAAKRRT
jgi:[methyl-Co(III) methylamine-specific corrinoid protein]:coenzyme M methyltransferase